MSMSTESTNEPRDTAHNNLNSARRIFSEEHIGLLPKWTLVFYLSSALINAVLSISHAIDTRSQ
jgi:hypothetical protein